MIVSESDEEGKAGGQTSDIRGQTSEVRGQTSEQRPEALKQVEISLRHLPDSTDNERRRSGHRGFGPNPLIPFSTQNFHLGAER